MRLDVSCGIRFRHTFQAILLGGTIVACGGTPTAPGPPDQGQLRILSDPVVTLTIGERRTLAVQEVDAEGRGITGAPESYVWMTSDSEIVSVAPGGVFQAGDRFGHAVIGIKSGTGRTANIHVWVQLPPGAPSSYRITLEFAADVSDSWRAEFAAAAARWEERIRGDLPPVRLDGLPQPCTTPPGEPEPLPVVGVERGTRIYIGQSGHFPKGTYVEAVGGACVQRPLPYPTTLYGHITLNRDKPFEGIGVVRRQYLALHEMGHVLGLVGVIQGRQPDWFDLATSRYSGPLGLEGYRHAIGQPVPFVIVPSGHWPWSGDVMGVSTNTVISPASIGALMDLGYPAFW